MTALAVIVVEERWRDLWLRRVGGLTLLGRALLALERAGIATALVGARDSAGPALGTRKVKSVLSEFPPEIPLREVAQNFGVAESGVCVISRAFFCDRAAIEAIAAGAPPQPLEAGAIRSAEDGLI